MAQYRQSGGVDNRLGANRTTYDLHHSNNNGGEGTSSSPANHVSIGIRGSSSSSQTNSKPSRPRRSRNSNRRISIGAFVIVFSLALFLSVFAFFYVSDTDTTEISKDNNAQDEDSKNDLDFLTNVTRTEKVLEFGKGSIKHGGDSRYWDRDDRRRDGDYNEDDVTQQHDTDNLREGSISKNIVHLNKVEKSSPGNDSDKRGVGLYNEAGRNELRMYEAEYEASLKNVGLSVKLDENDNQMSHNKNVNPRHEADDEYDDGIDLHDALAEDYNNIKHDYNEAESYNVDGSHSGNIDAKSQGRTFLKSNEEETNGSTESSLNFQSPDKVNTNLINFGVTGNQSLRRAGIEKRPDSKKKTKRHKFSGCEMKLINSTAQLVEPIESPKFARFSLQYVAVEEHSDERGLLEPKFAGYQSLQEREESFLAHDKKINCGFVKGPEGSPSTGFDLAEDDARYLSSCHIAVVSCIFGNSDRLRTPMGKAVSRLSRKNVCFVMFIDEITLQTLTSEGQTLDSTSFIGIWKIVVVKNLPYSDMRRVGKVPKFLSHRLFPKARYSIWLDSKLRLQLDPLLILEYLLWRKGHEYALMEIIWQVRNNVVFSPNFKPNSLQIAVEINTRAIDIANIQQRLSNVEKKNQEKWSPPSTGSWKINCDAALKNNHSVFACVVRNERSVVIDRVTREVSSASPLVVETLAILEAVSLAKQKKKGHEYAISNHYDRHCVWEEVAQNKKLNKYNHTVIDEQFALYQRDGLKRFDSLDPRKLLPSNVPEGSFIVRAHTPMSNLFSCLWFNEVERFTPRDQLSFAYTYQKLRKMNPAKPFHLNMFKDCERRTVAKLFRHRSEEKRNMLQLEAETKS